MNDQTDCLYASIEELERELSLDDRLRLPSDGTRKAILEVIVESPDPDGLGLLGLLAERTDMPILFITGHGTVTMIRMK